MSNRIVYNGLEFTDKDIVSGSCILETSLSGSDLPYDKLTFTVLSPLIGRRRVLTNAKSWYSTNDSRGLVVDEGNTADYKYGDPIFYYFKSRLIGKFYVRLIRRVSSFGFYFECLSAMGLLDAKKHLGGMYRGDPASHVIADIMNATFKNSEAGYKVYTGPIPYKISDDVADTPLYEWLPIGKSRSNLNQILMAIGAVVRKDIDGDLVIKYPYSNYPLQITEDKTYIGGGIEILPKATDIEVVEHSFRRLPSDNIATLFDNLDGTGAVTNKLVTFKQPYYDLSASDGLTIISSGANHAYVTGTGILIGREYCHITKQRRIITGVDAESNVKSLSDATLVNELNSANVAARIASYYTANSLISCDIVHSGECPGDKVKLTNPFGQLSEGYIQSIDLSISRGILKSKTSILSGWEPGPFGNEYHAYELITQSGTFTVPAGVEKLKVILSQGGSGGDAGHNGVVSESETSPGKGGEPGAGGLPGKVKTVEINVTPGQTFAVTIGSGGAGGIGSSPEGSSGGESTFGEYSSADGAIPTSGVLNTFTGELLSSAGGYGVAGGNGGKAGVSEYGESLEYGDISWLGGQGADEHQFYDPNEGGYIKISSRGGGGAAYGRNGSDATETESGAGADAEPMPTVAPLGSGGNGGNGGGGNGKRAAEYSYFQGSGWQWVYWDPGTVGTGSAGNSGGSGYVLIFM